MPIDDTLKQLHKIKAMRSRQREIRDFEERLLLDSLEEMNQQLKGSPRPANQRKSFQLSKDRAIRDLQIQPDPARYNPQSDPKVQQLAETHGRHMEHLHNRNRDLERQRDEIRRRLEDLGRKPIKDDDSMNALLQELKDQEARNQKMLEELRRIMAQQHINVQLPPAAAAAEQSKKHQYIYPIYYGNSLVAEIIAVRQAYLQNGGNDPDILQQLAQMQAEAQAIDDSLRNRPVIIKTKDKHGHNSSSLFTLELENERLQRQLLLLQDQNTVAKQRRKDDREGRTRAMLVSYHAIPKTSGQISTQLTPLDIKPGLLGAPRRRFKTADRYFMREEWITRVDPFKEKIDSDVENKFGYDYGANVFLPIRPKLPPTAEVVSRGSIGMETLLPGKTNDVAPLDIVELPEPEPQPQQQPAAETIQIQYNDRETPYYKNHLTSRKLNKLEKNLRDGYSQSSLPNIRGTETAEWIQLQRISKDIIVTNSDKDQNLTNLNRSNNENKSFAVPTDFEKEFFGDLTHTEMNPENYNTVAARLAPQSRPQFLMEKHGQ